MKKHTDRKNIEEDYEELLIRIALEKYMQQEGQKLLEENELLGQNSSYQPSVSNIKSLRKKLKRTSLLKKKYSSKIHAHKISAAAIIIIFMFLISIVSVEAFRIKIFNLFVDMRDDHTEIQLRDNIVNENEGYRKGDYRIKAPNDYRLYESKRIKDVLTITYINSKKDMIIFEQSKDNTTTYVDTEEVDEIEEVKIGSVKGMISKKDNVLSLAWSNNDYIFYIVSNSESISKYELIRLGESIKIVDKDH